LEVDLILFQILLTAAVMTTTQPMGTTAPESFRANAQVKGPGGASAATFVIAVDRYNTDKDRAALQDSLKAGTDTFLAALRKMPAVGSIEVGGNKVPVHYAYQQTTPKGRTITVVTSAPVAFVGGAAPDAKPRAGYDVAVAQFQVDSVGLGNGSMAAAARVKAGGPSGVEIDDYATEAIKLVTVSRNLK
jgi:hypothetical protein